MESPSSRPVQRDPPDAAETFVRALYADVAGPLFGYALRLTDDRARAEEVVQETLVRAWTRAGELDLSPARCAAGCSPWPATSSPTCAAPTPPGRPR